MGLFFHVLHKQNWFVFVFLPLVGVYKIASVCLVLSALENPDTSLPYVNIDKISLSNNSKVIETEKSVNLLTYDYIYH